MTTTSGIAPAATSPLGRPVNNALPAAKLAKRKKTKRSRVAEALVTQLLAQISK